MSDNITKFVTPAGTASDRRVTSTRESLFTAFAWLMQNRAYDEIRVSDIADRAQVARSTFYEHFRSKEDLMLESIEDPFSVLAASAVGSCTPRQLRLVLLHFCDRRSLIRSLLSGITLQRLTRKLSSMISALLCSSQHESSDIELSRLRAIHSAGSQIALIRAWLSGEVANDIKPIVQLILKLSVDTR